jgi:tRNA (mo5U34)-methyltransferase
VSVQEVAHDAGERLGTFDVVLFLGVLYHLPNPLLALERVASVASDLLVVETVVDMVGFGRPAAAFYPGRELNGDPTYKTANALHALGNLPLKLVRA